MTLLTKRIVRKTSATVRDAGKIRELIVTLYGNNTIGLRPSSTRREETVTFESCWSLGVKQRVVAERAEKIAKKGKRK